MTCILVYLAMLTSVQNITEIVPGVCVKVAYVNCQLNFNNKRRYDGFVRSYRFRSIGIILPRISYKGSPLPTILLVTKLE